MRYLTIEEIIAIHQEIERQYGIDSTVLQPSNLESAIEAPKRSLFGEEVYPSLTQKAAALMCGILKLHPFLDGNNRTGFTSTVLFLELNGRTLGRRDEAEKICKETSQCNIDVDLLSKWLKKNSVVFN